MRLWVRVKDTPATAFNIPKNKEGDEQLIGFQLAVPMDFRDSAPFLCMSTEKVTVMENATMLGQSVAPPHPLMAEARH